MQIKLLTLGLVGFFLLDCQKEELTTADLYSDLQLTKEIKEVV